MIAQCLQRMVARAELGDDDIEQVVAQLAGGQLADAEIAAFLVALLMKGVSAAELAAIARAMRAQCVPSAMAGSDALLDTCGTGGGPATFNISTASALVCAAAGIPVAKHGSRSLSARSGSADVLEALGIGVDLPPAAAVRMLREAGFAFLHAPLYHPVMLRVLPVEAQLGIKTIFYTVVGPLINPAGASRHVLGVHQADLLEKVAHAARVNGMKRAMFVHGDDGMDEISPTGPTRIIELRDDTLHRFTFEPEQAGLPRCSLGDITADGPADSAHIIGGVLSGALRGPARHAVLLNAAAGLVAGARADILTEGVALAAHLIDSGQAKAKLAQLVGLSQRLMQSQD